jgi:hypothetical protein
MDFKFVIFDTNEIENNDIIKDIKGNDKMSSLAQRWVDQGIETAVQQGIFETAIRMIA